MTANKRAAKAPQAPVAEAYLYKGKNKKGKAVKGEFMAMNANAAKLLLKKQGVQVTSIKKKPKDIKLPFGLGEKKLGSDDIAIFTRQMATMMKAGVPLVAAFDIVAEGGENPKLSQLLGQLKNNVAGGGTFAGALKEHPRVFDDLYCSLVESGEQAGALETMLDRVAIYLEKSETLKKKIKSAIKYPITILVIAAIVTAILMIKVVPIFAGMFTSFGADLPAPTKVVVAMSDWFVANWFYALAIIIGGVFTFKEAKQRSKKFRHNFERFTLKLPVFGPLLITSAVARYARTLSTTFAAGVPLVDALDSAAGASGNIVYYSAIKNIKNEVETGNELAISMKDEDVFPPMLIQMVAIGEQAGALDDMLAKAASIYEEEVDVAVDGLTAMMEPLIMAFLGVVIGGLVVAMYLPIFKMGSVVGG